MTDVKWLHSEHKYAWDVAQWAEYADEGPNLDPIGASDMLHDLHQYAVTRHRMGTAPESPVQLWEDFQRTEIWYQYYPSHRPAPLEWREVSLEEFSKSGHKGVRVTKIASEDGTVRVTYEVVDYDAGD